MVATRADDRRGRARCGPASQPDGVDVTTTQFLLKKALLRKKEEEEEEEKRKEEVLERKRDELFALLDMPPEHRTPVTREYRASKRKRKKKRKRRLPRTSSLFSPRRRLRQWHLQGWFSRFRAFAVSPLSFGRPKLLDFTDGMDQKDSCIGFYKASIFGCSAPSSLVCRPMVLGSHYFLRASCIWQSLYCVWCCLWSLGLWNFREMTPGMISVLDTPLFGSGHIYGVSLRSFLEEFPSFLNVMLGSTVDTSLCVRLRRPYFSIMLGSTVDTSLCVRLRRLVFLVTIHLALCSFPVFWPVMLDIMASMDLRDSFMRDFPWSSWTRLSCPLCATTHAPVQLLTAELSQVQLIIKVIYIPFAAQSLVPMVQTVQQTMRFHDCSSLTRISHARY